MNRMLMFFAVTLMTLAFSVSTSHARESRAEWVQKGCSASTYLMSKDFTCAQYKCMLRNCKMCYSGQYNNWASNGFSSPQECMAQFESCLAQCK